jgi:translocation and assembly module TamB
MRADEPAAVRRRKPVWIALCIATVLLLGGLGSAAWVMLDSATGVALVLRTAAALARIDVQLRDPSGRLLDRFGLGQIEIHAGSTTVVVTDLQARVGHWSLRPLQVAFDSIRASGVQVTMDSTRQGHSRPQRIAAPLQWAVGKLQIDALEYRRSPDPGGPALRFRSIQMGLASSPAGYQVSAGRFETAGVDLQLDGTLGTQWPFPLTATGHVRSHLVQRPVQADWTASGSLDQLELSARLTGSDVAGEVTAHLASFTAPYVTRVEADLRGIDPAQWKAGAPHAQLDVRVDLRPPAERASQLNGTFEALNRAEGTFDSQQIPLRRLRGAVAASFDAGGATILLPAIEAELARGDATGRIEIGSREGVEQWSVDAALRQVDLSRLHSRVRALRVDGTVHLENRPIDGGTGFAARGDLHARNPLPAELTFDLEGGAERFRLRSAHLALNAGSFDAQGLFERDTKHLQLQGAAHSLDAGLLLRGVRTRIEGHFEIEVALAPEPHGVGRFELADSSICWPAARCWPAHGRGVVELSSSQQLRADAELALNTARLQVHGALTGSQGRLEIELTAPQLADVDATLHGTVEAHAVLSGPWDAPDVQLHARAKGLRAFGQAADSASLDLHGKPQRDAPFDLDASVEALGPEGRAPPWLQAAAVHAQGTAHDHTVSVQAQMAGPRHVTLLARGGLGGQGWTGVLAQAQLDGPQPVRLSEPAPLAADRAGFSLGPAQVQALGASVRDVLFQYGAQGLISRGHFDGLRVPQSTPLAGVSIDTHADPLQLRGHWDLELGERIRGQFAIDRESGDLRPSLLEATVPASLGLRALSALIRIDQGQVQAEFSMDSERAGTLRGNLQAAIRHGLDRNWGLDRTQPWHVEVTGQLPAIEALQPFFPQQVRANLRIAGRIGMSLRIDGTPAQPQASGSIQGDELRLAWIDQGIRLQDGRLRARVEGDRVQVEELRFEGPLRVAPGDRRARDAIRGNPVGSVSASGQVVLSDLSGSLQVQAHQLPVLQRSDRWLLVSGGGNVELAPQRIRMNATLMADAGFLDLSWSDLPKLSDDVRVIQPSRPAAAPAPGIAIAADLGIDLGPAFFLRGNGLEARITGPLRLQSEGQGPLRVNGAVSIEQGTYEGFGQHLSIRYGRVNFQGAADNPGLDVLAVRTDLPVEVGVTVTGSVTRPIVRLHSDPPLPDYETLSWLALGRAPSDPRTDNVALARLAAGLLSGSDEGIPTRLARSIGIDEINLRSADVPPGGTLLPRQSVAGKLTADDTTTAATASNQIISLGHRINDAITVSYEQAVSGASNVVQISYQLSRRLSLIGRAGSDNALSLVFSLPFD